MQLTVRSSRILPSTLGWRVNYALDAGPSVLGHLTISFDLSFTVPAHGHTNRNERPSYPGEHPLPLESPLPRGHSITVSFEHMGVIVHIHTAPRELPLGSPSSHRRPISPGPSHQCPECPKESYITLFSFAGQQQCLRR